MRRPRLSPPSRIVGRPGILSLGMPPHRYDLTKSPGFESEEFVAGYDFKHAKMLRRRAAVVGGKAGKALMRLADRIDPDVADHPTTPASQRYSREQRIRILGSLWRLLHSSLPDKSRASAQLRAATFTAVPENWSVPLGMLHTVDAERLMQRFRQHLNRVIAKMEHKPGGWLFACLHGAYDPTTGTFPLHIHGFATGDMITVLKGLRELGVYAPAKAGDCRDAANTPVMISRKPLSNMPEPITYCLQRWWPLRATYLSDDGLRHAFRGPRRRVPEPAHSEYLQFLDCHGLDQLMLRIGITVSANGLVAR